MFALQHIYPDNDMPNRLECCNTGTPQQSELRDSTLLKMR
jgi:hypothetical protein